MPNERLVEGEVRAVARGGDSVVETELGVVLVPGALPRERVEIELARSRRGAVRGRLKRVLRASGRRVEPPCPEAARCGGCPLMIAEPSLQQEIKLGFLLEACRGLPGMEATEPRWLGSPENLGYRRRARLAWHGRTLGYRRLRSNRVVDIPDCIVWMEPLRRAWTATRLHLSGALTGSGELALQLTSAERVVIHMTTNDDQTPELFEACAALQGSEHVAGVSLRAGDGVAAAEWGNTEVVIAHGRETLRAPASGFSQANDGINEILVQTVADLAEPWGCRVLELHSGVGNFTVELASREPATLVAVERDPAAVRACQANLERRGLRARVTAGDANAPPKEVYEVLVVDPPRQGARELFETGGVVPGPERVVYVSCDTATLSRDLKLATKHGYRVDHVIGFDMFPQTAHLESVVRLVRT